MKPNNDQPKDAKLEYHVIAINKSGDGSQSNTVVGFYEDDVIGAG
jgi:hypothetical protein